MWLQPDPDSVVGIDADEVPEKRQKSNCLRSSAQELEEWVIPDEIHGRSWNRTTLYPTSRTDGPPPSMIFFSKNKRQVVNSLVSRVPGHEFGAARILIFTSSKTARFRMRCTCSVQTRAAPRWLGDAATGYICTGTPCPHEKLEVRSIAGTVVVCLFGPSGRFWA